jgi:hypothetical protein
MLRFLIAAARMDSARRLQKKPSMPGKIVEDQFGRSAARMGHIEQSEKEASPTR